jgi:mono/diheme cytochrome c family protein
VFRPLLAVAAGALLVLACGPDSKESTPAAETAPGASGEAIPAATEAQAEQIFASRCATCHGPEGGGDGPASAGLDPKPRNFQDPAWQKSVTDEHIETIIMYGGAAVGRSPAMPANPDLTSKPEVVAALREHVRSLAR